jgi:hypothetical protein
MSAFAAATAVLMADPNMGGAALWRAAPHDPPLSVRVVRSRPDQTLDGFRSASVIPTDILLVAVADLAEPEAGSTFTIGSDVLVVLSAERDAVHAAWRVECRRG